jgi:hypothetical protein
MWPAHKTAGLADALRAAFPSSSSLMIDGEVVMRAADGSGAHAHRARKHMAGAHAPHTPHTPHPPHPPHPPQYAAVDTWRTAVRGHAVLAFGAQGVHEQKKHVGATCCLLAFDLLVLDGADPPHVHTALRHTSLHTSADLLVLTGATSCSHRPSSHLPHRCGPH